MFKWIADWRERRRLKRFYLVQPYRMLPTDDGGESYRMECIFCKEEGSIMSKFTHAENCPARNADRIPKKKA
jgi:hypothetical protein